MKLVLTDDEGTVVDSWSIAFEYDFDPEDIHADGEHDLYLVDGVGASEEREIGEIVGMAIKRYRQEEGN